VLRPDARRGGSLAWLSAPGLKSRDSIDHDALGAMIMLWRGEFAKLPDEIDKHLVSYMLRYTGASLRDLDGCTLSRLRNLADGVGRIIEAENKA
jgi:hypothetical protein